MLDLGFSEMMLIAAVALVVLGPERLPKVARTVGHLVGRMQRYVNDVKADITREIELDELRKFKQTVEETATSMQSSFSSLEADARAVGRDLEQLARDQARGEPELPLPAPDAAGASDNAGVAPVLPAPGHDVLPGTLLEASPEALARPAAGGFFDQDLASVMGSPARPATYGATTALAMTTPAGRLTGRSRWPTAVEA